MSERLPGGRLNSEQYRQRILDAKGVVIGQFIQVSHGLAGEPGVQGDERTLLRFEAAFLRGMFDMAMFVLNEHEPIGTLVAKIAKERMDCLTGKVETGVLHTHPVDLDLSQAGAAHPLSEVTHPLDGEGDI